MHILMYMLLAAGLDTNVFFVWTPWILVQSAAEHIRDPFTAKPAHMTTTL